MNSFFNTVLKAVFWSSMAIVFYANIVYPAVVFVMSVWMKKTVRKSEIRPFVSVIIPLFNEERIIRDKIVNVKGILYPSERHEVIFISDGSTDATCRIINEYKGGNFILLEHGERRGKTAVVNEAAKVAKGEIIVFCDASGMVGAEAIGRMVANFHDPTVGAVLGIYRVDKEATHIDWAEERYWDLELFLKKRESLIWTTLGGHGALYAVRRELFDPLSAEVINDDFVIPARISLKGYRTVYEEGSILYDRISTELPQEIKRRVRIAYGNWQQIFILAKEFRPGQAFLIWQFFSHKVLRTCEGILCMFITAGSLLIPGTFYRSTAAVIGIGAVLALLGFLSRRFKALKKLNIFFLPALGIYTQIIGTFRFVLKRKAPW